ncbi:DUF7507 domain-containing protein, partial [Belliella kenyensis]|nr:hypothetical protein [Belliella kenyensis]
PILTVGTVTCSDTGYSFTVTTNATNVTVSAGTYAGGVVTAPLGVDVIVTASSGVGCETVATVVAPATCPTDCVFPNLTVGNGVCEGLGSGTYSVAYLVAPGTTDITVSSGTLNVAEQTVTGIPLGTDLTITAGTGDCATSVVVSAPISCDDPCTEPLLSISGAVCEVGATSYQINYYAASGVTVTSTAGTVDATNQRITGIPNGVSVVLTASFAGCENQEITVAPPADCTDAALTLLKSGTFVDSNGDGFAQVGETISYSFTVRNTGNVEITNLLITDPLVTVVGGPLASLAPGAIDESTFTATYTITQADIDAGYVYNLATVTGQDPS